MILPIATGAGRTWLTALTAVALVVTTTAASAMTAHPSERVFSVHSGGGLLHPERVVLDGANRSLAHPSLWRMRYAETSHSTATVQTLKTQAAAGLTVPFWTASITSPLDGLTYTTSMVGGSPYASAPALTQVGYVPIIARVHFRNGVVLDPTRPACGDTASISARFFNSPLFAPNTVYSNGVKVAAGGANSQLISAFQRANYWKAVGASAYGVQLIPVRSPAVVDLYAPWGSSTMRVAAVCNGRASVVTLGEIDINTYDNLVQSVVSRYATANQLPVLLTYNLVQTDTGSCCILGYHSVYPTWSGTQTYAVGSYIDGGVFGGVDDTVIWSHELAEWMDDPFVQAPVAGGFDDDDTPAWGNIGQVDGCQNDLEVGDPLSGTEFAIRGAGGFTYHYQDLAFHDWFYRTASSSAGGKYSFQGLLSNTQSLC